jgi:hypothetical protein
MIITFSKKMESTNEVVLVVLIALISYFIKIPAVLINDAILENLGITNTILLSDQQIPELTFMSFFFSVLIAPSVETFVAQYIPIKIAKRFSLRRIVIVSLSAFVFMLLHLPVIGFMFPAFCIGLVLAWFYLIKMEKDPLKAFILVTASHSLHNLLAFFTVFLVQVV